MKFGLIPAQPRTLKWNDDEDQDQGSSRLRKDRWRLRHLRRRGSRNRLLGRAIRCFPPAGSARLGKPLPARLKWPACCGMGAAKSEGTMKTKTKVRAGLITEIGFPALD